MTEAGAPAPLRTLDQLASDKLARLVVDSAISAVVTMDSRGIVTGWGARAASTFGWPARSALGQPLVELIVPQQYRAAHNDGLARFRATGEGPVLGKVVEVSALHRDGHEFPVELRISPAGELDGETVFIAFVLDISERHAQEAEVRAALQEAREARSAIDEFVNMVVHELRQPLSLTLGYADLLLDDDQLSAKASEHAQEIVDASTTALRLVDDILMAARIASGGLQPDLAPVDLARAATEAVERAQPVVALRDGTIHLAIPSRSIPPAVADDRFVARILDNLVSNAIKYSASSPQIRVGLAQSQNVIEVSVADSGRGLPEAMHERIFERFVRVEDRDPIPGSGLGLYVSRSLAQLQGGDLRLVRSTPGEGSVFALSLPRSAPVDPAAAAVTPL